MKITPSVLLTVSAILLVTGGMCHAQSIPHEPGPDGIIPQAHVALTNTHVLDVRNGEILHDAIVVVRDGNIVSVGTEPPPP